MCHFSSARWTAVFCLKNAGVHVSRGIPTGIFHLYLALSSSNSYPTRYPDTPKSCPNDYPNDCTKSYLNSYPIYQIDDTRPTYINNYPNDHIRIISQWIGLRENLQETMDICRFSCIFSPNHSIDQIIPVLL